MPAAYCTVTDLSAKLGDETRLAEFAADNRVGPYLLTDSDVQTRLSFLIEGGSAAVRRKLIGRLPSLDTDIATDAQLAADLRDCASVWALKELFKIHQHVTTQSNPYLSDWTECLKGLDNIAEGREKVGSAPAPEQSGASSTSDSSPEYAPPATGGGGESSSFRRRW